MPASLLCGFSEHIITRLKSEVERSKAKRFIYVYVHIVAEVDELVRSLLAVGRSVTMDYPYCKTVGVRREQLCFTTPNSSLGG